MYLQKLEIQGFKSFANRVTLTFNQGITAVVGPNGSGKSNVSDAVRWVLGEQSMKLLRGKKAEDVIFAGSDKKNRLGSAEVSVHFNNEDGRAPIDASEFVITRRVYRSGESEYLLNNKPTRLTDIALLLAKSNFGQRSYSIIGQGMIDEVLTATPAGRKVFFDEAAGVRAFQIKKEQAEVKLGQTKENVTRVDMLVQEIEPRLRSLTRQVKKLEQRSEIEHELRTFQDAYYRSLWHEVQDQLTDERNKHNEEFTKKQALEEQRHTIEEQLTIEEARKTRDEEFERLQREYQRLIDDKNALLREQSSIKGKRDADLASSGKSNVVWIEKKLEDADRKLFEVEEQIEDVRSETKKLVERKEQFTQQYEALQGDLLRHENELEALRKETGKTITLPEISDQLEIIFSKHEQLLSRLGKIQSLEHMPGLQKEYHLFHKELQEVVKRIRESDNSVIIHSLQQKEQSLKVLIQKKEALALQVHSAESERRVLEERMQHVEEEKEELGREKDALNRELEQAQASGDDRGAVLDSHEQEITKKIDTINEEIETARKAIESFNAQEQKKKDVLVAMQKSFAEVGQQLSDIVRSMNQFAVEIARLETRQEDLEREMRQELIPELIESIKSRKGERVDRNEAYGNILRYKKQLEMIGGIDEQVTEEYKDTKQRYDFLTHQLDDLQKAVADLEEAITDLDETIKKRFNDAFQKINKEFGTYFKKLFGGGKASLELIKEEKRSASDDDEEFDDDEDDDDEEEESKRQPRGEKIITGVAIFATPPGKKLKSVGALSGGERALTSIALISAIISNNPSPFVVLDEVDAALDEANSERFSMILDQLAKHTQFITITHNRATMEHASILYGVTMGDDGISKLLSVNIENAEDIISRTGNR